MDKFYSLITKIVLLCSALSLVACGGGGGGGSTSSTNGLQFSVEKASIVIANKSAIAEVRGSNRRTAAGDPVFSYQIADGSENGLRFRHDGVTEHGVTNLVSIDDSGQVTIAMQANDPIKVDYTAVNPDGTKLYVILAHWSPEENIDYSKFFTKTNCTIYEVDLIDNTNYRCVAEGLFAQQYDSEYAKVVGNNTKPIQFDSVGNIYFLATAFEILDFGTDENGDPELWWVWENDEWAPRLYKHNAATETTTALNQDAGSISNFIALSNGDVVALGAHNSPITFELIKADSSRIDLRYADDAGVSYFAVDNNDTVVFSSQFESAGLRFVTPAGTGIQKTTMDTSLFARVKGGGYFNSTAQRVILADDGNVYGIFEGDTRTKDGSGNWVGKNTLNFYQILPYDPTPKATIELGDLIWWEYLEKSPPQVSQGYLFYVNPPLALTIDNADYGTYDSITIVDLKSSETKPALIPLTASDPRYQIFIWRLSGTKLYFSALDQSSNNIDVMGVIDTQALETVGIAAAESDYITIQETASALGSVVEVSDITVIQSTLPEEDPGGASNAEFFVNGDNLHSASIRFTKYMDKDSVLAGLSLTNDDTSAPVNYVPLWVHKSLHLVPDIGSLTDDAGASLENDTSYSLTLAPTINDLYGTAIDNTTLTSGSVMTLPSSGWYSGSTDTADINLSSGSIAKFSGNGTSTYIREHYKLVANLPANFSLEFSAKNKGWTQIGVSINDTTGNISTDHHGTGQILDQYIDSAGVWTDYVTNTDSLVEIDPDNDAVNAGAVTANSEWVRYKITVIGSNYSFSSSTDGLTYSELLSVTDMKSAEFAELYLMIGEKAYIDNILLSELDGGGAAISPGDLYDFSDFDPLPVALQAETTDFGIGW
ncbi:MAG: hypothetical protein ACI87H_002949 [Gammaproteobacteria bacterium]|jgi:hypothetical protein